MSTEIKKEVTCPGCGAKVPARMWSGINAEVNPNLRQSVLDETLFDWRCPQCGYEAVLAYPCLYHDKGRRFMIYILPGEPDAGKAAGIAAQFPQLRGVRKRVTGSLATLKEKILLFEDGLDDRAAELVKLLLEMVLARRTGRRVEQGFYCSSDEAADRIGFSFFLEGVEDPVRRVTSFAAYRQALAIVESMLPADGEEFLVVNEKFARSLLYRYRGSEPPEEEAPQTAAPAADGQGEAARDAQPEPEAQPQPEPEPEAQPEPEPEEAAQTAPAAEDGAQAEDEAPSDSPGTGGTEGAAGEPFPAPTPENEAGETDEAGEGAQDAPKTEMGE